MEDKRTLEELFSALDEVVQKMESGDISLEESFHLYKKGIDLLKECNDRIDNVEKQIMVLEENGELHEF